MMDNKEASFFIKMVENDWNLKILNVFSFLFCLTFDRLVEKKKY